MKPERGVEVFAADMSNGLILRGSPAQPEAGLDGRRAGPEPLPHPGRRPRPGRHPRPAGGEPRRRDARRPRRAAASSGSGARPTATFDAKTPRLRACRAWPTSRPPTSTATATWTSWSRPSAGERCDRPCSSRTAQLRERPVCARSRLAAGPDSCPGDRPRQGWTARLGSLISQHHETVVAFAERGRPPSRSSDLPGTTMSASCGEDRAGDSTRTATEGRCCSQRRHVDEFLLKPLQRDPVAGQPRRLSFPRARPGRRSAACIRRHERLDGDGDLDIVACPPVPGMVGVSGKPLPVESRLFGWSRPPRAGWNGTRSSRAAAAPGWTSQQIWTRTVTLTSSPATSRWTASPPPTWVEVWENLARKRK